MKRGPGSPALVLLLASGLGCVPASPPEAILAKLAATSAGPTAEAEPQPDAGLDAANDAGPSDGAETPPADAGLAAPLGPVAEGTTCDWERPRYDLVLDDGQVFAVDLSSPDGDDPDLHLYRATDLDHPVLIGRAAGDDRLLIRGTGDVVVAEVSSWNGDCMDWQLRLDIATEAEAASLVTLQGTVGYRDRVHDAQGFTGALPEVPARGARIDLVQVGGDLVVSTTTGDDGAFGFEAPLAATTSYRLRALATLESFGQWVRVRDRTQDEAVYAIESEAFTADAPPAFHAMGVETEVGGAFNIIDRIHDAHRVITRWSPHLSPPLTVSWERGQAHGCGSCFSGTRISLGGQLEDPDEYDDDIVLHEFGHYFARYYAPDDSPGGAHRDTRVDPYLAWGEGLAYFFAAMIKEEPGIVDNYLDDVRFTDLDAVTLNGDVHQDFTGSSDGTLGGDMREEVVGALLWDAYDDDGAEAWDELALGEEGVMTVLLTQFGGDFVDVGPQGRELADWLHGVACYDPTSTLASQRLLADRQLPWPDDAGQSCANKTLRDELPLETRPDGSTLLIEGPPALERVEVGTLLVDGTLGPAREYACPSSCSGARRSAAAATSKARASSARSGCGVRTRTSGPGRAPAGSASHPSSSHERAHGEEGERTPRPAARRRACLRSRAARGVAPTKALATLRVIVRTHAVRAAIGGRVRSVGIAIGRADIREAEVPRRQVCGHTHAARVTGEPGGARVDGVRRAALRAEGAEVEDLTEEPGGARDVSAARLAELHIRARGHRAATVVADHLRGDVLEAVGVVGLDRRAVAIGVAVVVARRVEVAGRRHVVGVQRAPVRVGLGLRHHRRRVGEGAAAGDPMAQADEVAELVRGDALDVDPAAAVGGPRPLAEAVESDVRLQDLTRIRVPRHEGKGERVVEAHRPAVVFDPQDAVDAVGGAAACDHVLRAAQRAALHKLEGGAVDGVPGLHRATDRLDI
jgi:hypothetical protein